MLRLHIHSSLAAIALCLAMEAAAKSPVIDGATPQSVTTISREQLESLPAGRRVEDLIKTCPKQTFPTVTRDSRMLVDGQPVSSSLSINCLVPTDVEMIEVYQAHNAARAEYGAPPLARDPALELSAGEYVGQLVRTGKTVHAPREGRGNVRENISQGLPSWSARQLLGSWLKEKQNFVPGTFPNVSRTGNWYDIGHWSQMIWIRTALIGCARAAGIGATWMVCRYGPGGNKDGEQVGVPPPPRPYLVEAPKLPSTEVYGQNQIAALDGEISALFDEYINRNFTSAFHVPSTPLLYLSIYPTEMWTKYWLNELPLESYASQIILNHEYGYDPGLFVGYDLGAFRLESEVAYKKAEQDVSAGERKASLFDLGIYSGGAWTTDWFELNAEGYNDGTPKVAGKQDPSNPLSKCPTFSSLTPSQHQSFFTASDRYGDAKDKGDTAGMVTARTQMEMFIAQQRAAIEAATEAGEMATVKPSELESVLKVMMKGYQDLTGASEPGTYDPLGGAELMDGLCEPTDTAVQQPQLPAKEVFKLDPPVNLDDPM